MNVYWSLIVYGLILVGWIWLFRMVLNQERKIRQITNENKYIPIKRAIPWKVQVQKHVSKEIIDNMSREDWYGYEKSDILKRFVHELNKENIIEIREDLQVDGSILLTAEFYVLKKTPTNS